jgi:anhydro-N-acetylmuramic acid kinase
LKIIGLMSGTSVDGIDAALVEVRGQGYALEVDLLAAETYGYPAALRSQILAVCAGHPLCLSEFAELDDAIARVFAEAAQTLMVEHGRPDLIASHGQTVYHRPPQPHQPGNRPSYTLGYSLQLGRGALIAAQTGCPTVSNFRQGDLALGGQGAPLVPPVDACLLSHAKHARCVQNIGGIGNVTYLPAWQRPLDDPTPPFPTGIQGWDTGPGNALIDWAVSEFTQGQQTYDQNGAWAAQGQVCEALIEHWLQHSFFRQAPPKSTGRECFGASYGQQCWQTAQDQNLSQADFLATLTSFTAVTIAHSYRQFLKQLPTEILLCGGGSRNAFLRQQLQEQLPSVTIRTTDDVGISADYKEAMAFAVLGFWRWYQIPANLPTATGAHSPGLLGDLYLI